MSFFPSSLISSSVDVLGLTLSCRQCAVEVTRVEITGTMVRSNGSLFRMMAARSRKTVVGIRLPVSILETLTNPRRFNPVIDCRITNQVFLLLQPKIIRDIWLK